VQQCRASWLKEGRDWTWEQLTRLAAEAPPLVTLVDPNDHSLVAPASMPDAIRGLAKQSGQPVPESTAAVVRAALESVAAACRSTLRQLDRLLGRRVSRVHVVGGGVKNSLLCQLIADATGRTVVAGPVEATAIGNLLVQMMAAGGSVDLKSVRQVVRDSFELATYEPKNSAAWDARLAE
jgi:rhamnulokinase